MIEQIKKYDELSEIKRDLELKYNIKYQYMLCDNNVYIIPLDTVAQMPVDIVEIKI